MGRVPPGANLLFWRLWLRKNTDPVVIETTWSISDLAIAHSLLDFEDAINEDANADTTAKARR